jgi:hypothetical protein
MENTSVSTHADLAFFVIAPYGIRIDLRDRSICQLSNRGTDQSLASNANQLFQDREGISGCRRDYPTGKVVGVVPPFPAARCVVREAGLWRPDCSSGPR